MQMGEGEPGDEESQSDDNCYDLRFFVPNSKYHACTFMVELHVLLLSCVRNQYLKHGKVHASCPSSSNPASVSEVEQTITVYHLALQCDPLIPAAKIE
jgi:hypothetical protein